MEQTATNLKCYTCGERKPRDQFPRHRGKTCVSCEEADLAKAKKRENYRKRYSENKEQWRGKNEQWKAENRDAYLAQQREAAKTKREGERRTVLMHYGGTCACCGESEPLFLQIDHINGDGGKHRREIGKTDMIKWLIAKDFPDGFQLLCANCNTGKHRNGGVCPHGQG